MERKGFEKNYLRHKAKSYCKNFKRIEKLEKMFDNKTIACLPSRLYLTHQSSILYSLAQTL